MEGLSPIELSQLSPEEKLRYYRFQEIPDFVLRSRIERSKLDVQNPIVNPHDKNNKHKTLFSASNIFAVISIIISILIAIFSKQLGSLFN